MKTRADTTWTCDFPGCDEWQQADRGAPPNGWGSWCAFQGAAEELCACPHHSLLVKDLFANGTLTLVTKAGPTGTQVLDVGNVTRLGPPPRIDHSTLSPSTPAKRSPTRPSWLALRWRSWNALSFEHRTLYILLGCVVVLSALVVHLMQKVGG